jgi:hypothetical protein
VGRRTPYTERGIRRLKCTRCGARAATQWQICGDGNQYRPLCIKCDVALNRLVMKWAGLDFNAAAYAKALMERTRG